MTPAHTPLAIAFTGSTLDRASAKRPNDEWLRTARTAPDAMIVPLWQLRPFFLGTDTSDELKVGWLTPPALAALGLSEAETIFLGEQAGRSHFAIDISALPNPEERGPLAGLGRFIDLRSAAATLNGADLAVLGQAKALLDWHKRHGFCANCGAPTRPAEAGYRRDCAQCRSQHFPRTDPVVIMLAARGDHVLLGRQPVFPARMFSALAGFIEPGESIEEAVAREIHEEAGVLVGRVRYIASQPWPFPSSLMIGCIAEALSEEIIVDGQELAEARWFSRDDVRTALDTPAAGVLGVPPPFAIAHQLMRAWLSGI